MDIQILRSKISHFWDWFVRNEVKFRIITDPHEVREQLDNQVLPFGKFSWEIGEGANNMHTFTISPNGNEQLLQISEAIIGEAPSLSKWEFYAAKPARNWDFIIEVYDDFLIKQTVDTSQWKYVLRITTERKLRLLLYAPLFTFVDEEDRMASAELVINYCIGEMDKIYFIESIVFVRDLEEAQLNEFRPIPELSADFEKIVNVLL